MIYTRQTRKSVAEATRDMEAAVAAHGFGVLHAYDFQKTLGEKGFPLANGCRVLEVCNPRQASEVLATDMALNMVLPCRVSIYEDKGATLIGMIPPTDLLALVSKNPGIASAAADVERVMRAIIDDAV